MKTYLELEQIGIVGNYVYKDKLHIIVKGGDVWYYEPVKQSFIFLYTL